ncbi:MAG: hypothetical protein V4577_19505 [Bacteroidota bacterium]
MPTTNYNIVHIFDGDKHDFNTLALPMDLLLPLSNYMKAEYQTRLAQASARSFKEERALQQQRYLERCAETGDTPHQIFIDFPV